MPPGHHPDADPPPGRLRGPHPFRSPADVDDDAFELTPQSRSWPKLPGYEIVRELGRGGAAVVYLARQTALDRLVALKMILSGALATDHERTRLRREAEAVARLEHPNVVRIYDIGEHAGSLYLSLEFVPGGSLDAQLAVRPLPPLQTAALVEALCGAVQAAHDAGIVHRDLKPANVLLGADAPKVTDFGLAFRPDAGPKLTRTGTAAGTPSYMAPEQVIPVPEMVGPATDVYALGGIIYECLTARPPFVGPTTLETMRQIADDPVVPIEKLQPHVPLDLQTICLKCLEKDPRRRYASAAALADDLRRFRHGEPIAARPLGPVSRAWRWSRRHPTVPLLAVTLGLMIVTAAVLMTRSTVHAYRAAVNLRERELELHGLRGALLHRHETAARFLEVAATTGDVRLLDRHRAAAEEADGLRARAAELAATATAESGLLAAAGRLGASEAAAADRVRAGGAADAWAALQGAEHQLLRDEYTRAVRAFADRVDREADAELRQVQGESYWSLATATAVTGLLGVALVAGWLVAARRRSAAAARPADQKTRRVAV